MRAHTVTLTLQVQAETTADALDLALGAGVHLLETFNDDGSIVGTVRAEVLPPARQPATA